MMDIKPHTASNKTKRRRRKSKGKRSIDRHSDPELPLKEGEIERDHHGWDSLDERWLPLDERAAVLDEMEVTSKRLSSLNVTCDPPKGSTPPPQNNNSSIPSELETENTSTYVCVSSDLQKRYSRKRIYRRNRKRAKKAKCDDDLLLSIGSTSALSSDFKRVPNLLESHQFSIAQQSIVRLGKFHQSGVLTDDSQTGLTSHYGLSDETSSRAVTESDSPGIPDDILMYEESTDSEGHSKMEAKESSESSLSLTPKMTNTNNNTNGSSGESVVLRVSLKNPSDTTGSTSTSDSGCDGDDEESSAEVTRALLVGGNSSSCGVRHPFWSTYSESSADEICDDEDKYQHILNPLFGREGRQVFDFSATSNLLEYRGGGGGGRFKHPQLCSAQCRKGSGRKYRKKPPPLSPAIASPLELSRRINDFVSEGLTGPSELQLPMLSRSLCHVASRLSEVHSLDCLVSHGKRLLPVAAPLLRKTPSTHVGDKSKIDTILIEYETSFTNRIEKTEKCSALPVCVPLSTLPAGESTSLSQRQEAAPIGEASVTLMNVGWNQPKEEAMVSGEDLMIEPVMTSNNKTGLSLKCN